MSGWSDLASLGVTVRPLADPKPPRGNVTSPFSASLASTVEMLATELRALEARHVVVEVDIDDRYFRADGLPRANAPDPAHPGVALAFESKHGPLRYATAEYAGATWRKQPAWQANLRAIALSMQALRAVDRYGVSKSGEQYRGWRQLPRRAGEDMSAEQARDLLASYGGERAALHATHPDVGGNQEEFLRVQQARRVLAGTAA